MRLLKKTAAAATALVLGGLVGGCSETERTAVSYGERTGLNIGVFVDPTKSLPIETNVGLVRRVVSHVPALDCDAVTQDKRDDCLNEQDSVDVVSAFHMKRTAVGSNNTQRALKGKLTISTAFVTGKAAVGAAQNGNGITAAAMVADAVDANQETMNEAGSDTTADSGDAQPVQEAAE